MWVTVFSKGTYHINTIITVLCTYVAVVVSQICVSLEVYMYTITAHDQLPVTCLDAVILYAIYCSYT